MGRQENPSVNRSLKERAMDHIDHALGRPIWPLRESYRNHFAVEADSPLALEFDASPNWCKGQRFGHMASYSVTDIGRKALACHLASLAEQHQAFVVSYGGFSRIVPARSRSKARYAYYLEIGDCLNIPFSEFSNVTSVRRAE